MYVTTEPGIESNSEMFFFSATSRGRDLFYYPVCAGHFFCKNEYNVKRKQHYSILLMQIIRGKCHVETDFSSETASEGDTVIIDCWLPHTYRAQSDDLEILWLHMEGGNCRALCGEIVTQNGNVLHTDPSQNIGGQLEKIYNILAEKNDCPEAVLSSRIYSLFCSCFTPQFNTIKNTAQKERYSVSAAAKGYIFNHLNSKITVKELSGHVHLSPSQFSKIFKEQTGFSPYDYVLVTRMTKAKELLLGTALTISEIALETGFSTDCNFTTFFTSGTGMSPSKFRKEYNKI